MRGAYAWPTAYRILDRGGSRLAELRIGLVTDIHFGPDRPTRRGSAALARLEEFAREMRERFRPDLVVDLGDDIEHEGPEADRERFRTLGRLLARAGAPLAWVPGNHDTAHLSPAEAAAQLGTLPPPRVLCAGGLALLFLDTQDPTIRGIGGSLSEKQLAWLREELARQRGRPVLLFAHHPLRPVDVGANPFFASMPQLATVADTARVQETLAVAGNSLAGVFNGHLHGSDAVVEGGALFATLPSFSEGWVPGSDPPGAFAELRVETGGAWIELTLRRLHPPIVQQRLTLHRR